MRKKKEITPDRIYNWIMTAIAIIFIFVLFFKYGYTPATDMIIDNSSSTINIRDIENAMNGVNSFED